MTYRSIDASLAADPVATYSIFYLMLLRLKQFPILATAILSALIIRLYTSGLSWVGVVALAIAALWFGFEMVRWLLDRTPSPEKQATKSEELDLPLEELVSLVYFLTEKRDAEESSIRSCVSSALGIQFDTSSSDSEYFVIQFTPPNDDLGEEDGISHFMIRVPQGLFAVLVSDRPYISNPSQFAQQSIRDKRLRNAVESHQAWISVDLMDDPKDPASTDAAYQVIGKILAALAGPDCLAVYCPELQRCNEFDLSLIEQLASATPIELFNEPTFEPIIEISDSNPKMAAAVHVAVNRWPEFVSAFIDRDPDETDRYIAKAEFREGRKCEYMWVAVTEISDDQVCGILMNDPHELMDLHRGATVNFNKAKLNDWIYPNPDGSHVGGFTLDVLAEGDED